MKLADNACVPCRGGVPPLKGDELQQFILELGGEWVVIGEHHLERIYKFENFREALDFTNAVGLIAERENHHPEITLSWGKVIIRLWTHKINGLTASDFYFAAKADRAFSAP